MARKVLISFLGTGIPKSKDKNEFRQSREYQPVNYHLRKEDNENIEIGEYSFVGAALRDYYKMDMKKDTIILIGSIHSMWEEIYKTFVPQNEYDVEDHVAIGCFCDTANSTYELTSFDAYKQKIEKALGKKFHVVLIKYGVDEKEIQENLQIILGIQKYLNPGDEVIVDVTHSFRSLPIYIMQLLIFLKNVKNVNISKIYYGMFEMKNELGYAPIVDLSSILSVNDWIIGAYNFKEFGNTYKIADLLERENNEQYKSVIEPLRKFAEVKNLNYISDFKSQIQGLLQLGREENVPELGKMVVTPIMKDFFNDFKDVTNYSTFQYRMAKWHNDHYNYGYALMLLVEACVTYCCEELNIDYNNFNQRELTKKALILPDDQRNKKDVIERRIELINAFSSESEDVFDNFVLGSPTEERIPRHRDSNYLDLKSLKKIANGEKSSKGENKEYYGNGFKTQNANRNLIAHNGEGKKTYKTIISELKYGIEFLKTFLEMKNVKQEF